MIKAALSILFISIFLAQPGLAEVRRLSFESDGVNIPAYLHVPEDQVSDVLAVYLHGNPGSELAPESSLADVLIEYDISVFRFNYRGLWGNGGDFNLTNSIEDMRNAIDFLFSSMDELDVELAAKRLVLIGYSFGTAVALSGAHSDDRVNSIVALAPCDHGYFGNEIADPESSLREFLDDVTEQLFGTNGLIDQDPAIFTNDLVVNAERFRFEPIASELSNKKLLFLVGVDDTVCYAEDHFFPLYRALVQSKHGAVHKRILAMDHGFNGVGADKVFELAAKWIAESVR